MRFFLVLSALLLVSCQAHFDWPWLNKDSAPAHPKGVQVSEDRTVPAFDKVRLEGLGKLVFDAAVPAGTVRVRVDQGLLSKVQATVNGTTLVLHEEGVRGFGAFDLEFRLAPPSNLTEVTLAGLGSIEAAEPLRAQNLTLALDGMGKINLAVNAATVHVRQQGQGEVVVTGTADQVDVRADGLGRVRLSELTAKAVDVESNGLGEVTVNATQKLKVRANGLGAVHFSGHPAQTDVQTKGLTQVTASD